MSLCSPLLAVLCLASTMKMSIPNIGIIKAHLSASPYKRGKQIRGKENKVEIRIQVYKYNSNAKH